MIHCECKGTLLHKNLYLFMQVISSDWYSYFEIAEVQIAFLVYVLYFADIGVFKKSLDHHLEIC